LDQRSIDMLAGSATISVANGRRVYATRVALRK